jgi:Zn-dependent protease
MSADTDAVEVPARSAPWRTNLGLFVATIASVFLTGILLYNDVPEAKDAGMLRGLWLSLARQTPASLAQGAEFTGSLLTILVAHELGHYVAARVHKVDASLPFFIPMPVLSPFGTMGAVIRMRGVIPTRRALLDIGAAGPLAGLAFALPLYAWGVAHSHVIPIDGSDGMLELGESLLIRLLDHAFGPPVGDGMTAVYSPVAYGAWGGMFVTMINLLPVGQLDGGHVAYALFGPRQDRYAKLVHRALLAFFGVILVGHLGRDLGAGRTITAALVGRHVGNGLFWLVWFQLLAVLGSLASRAQRVAPEGVEAATIPIRTRLVATLGLVVVSSMWRERASWLIGGAFFAGLGLLVAMEVRGGVLRGHDLLDHPPTSADGLDVPRRAVAVVTLVFFALLFMPEPFSM